MFPHNWGNWLLIGSLVNAAMVLKPLRERCNRRRLEDVAQGHVGRETVDDARDDLGGEQRMAAQIEKVVVDTNGTNIEDFLPNPCKLLFDIGLRNNVGHI